MLKDSLTPKIIAAAIEVHKNLGPGLLESVYESSLEHELLLQGMEVQRQLSVPFTYKGIELNLDYRLDLLIENEIIIEIKSVSEVKAIHKAQLLTYLRLRGGGIGLLLNFNVSLLKDGIYRLKV
jgi:GxxExxY protein